MSDTFGEGRGERGREGGGGEGRREKGREGGGREGGGNKRVYIGREGGQEIK